MSYIALARQWRPRVFSELLGQDHVANALVNSLDQKRMHHAYLFTGTRGVGKTSIARLLAKALNCEQGIASLPCLQCDSCLAIEQSRFIDLIEIDGASRTRVEDTRELLENVQYAPTNGRFKIYLIDEVHMLSQHSFNALLKTLEEPPSHVKFILATTDPQKLPITVLSRCLQFNLKQVGEDIISKHLEHILQQESISYESPALKLLAKAARGSIRDALSLLDQAIASCRETITAQAIKVMLGHTQQDYAVLLLEALQAHAPDQLINLCHQIAIDGGQFNYVLNEMIEYLHQIAINQVLSTANTLLEINQNLQKLTQQFSPEDVQLLYQIALKGTQDMTIAPTMAIGFEMTMLRMYTFKPVISNAPYPIAQVEIQSIDHAVRPTVPQPIPTQQNACPLQNKLETANEPEWMTILSKLNLNGLARSAIENAQIESKSSGQVTLLVEKAHQSLFTAPVLSRIEKALADVYHEKIKVVLKYQDQVSSPASQKKMIQEKKHQDAESKLLQDPFFQQLQHEFSAELIKDSVIIEE